MKRLAVAIAHGEEEVAGGSGLEALRGTLATAGAAAREEVAVDFLEDDLRESQEALACIGEYLAEVAAALRSPRAGRDDLIALTRGERPLEQLDELQASLAGLRRRLPQVALRLPP